MIVPARLRGSTIKKICDKSSLWLDFRDGTDIVPDKSGRGSNAIMEGTPEYAIDTYGRYWQGSATNYLVASFPNTQCNTAAFFIVFSAAAHDDIEYRVLIDAGYYASPYGMTLSLRNNGDSMASPTKNIAGVANTSIYAPFVPGALTTFAGVFNGTDIIYYLNGLRWGSRALTTPVNFGNSNKVYIGAKNDGTLPAAVKTYLVGIWSQEISAADVWAVHNYAASGKREILPTVSSVDTSYFAIHDPATLLTTPTYDGSNQAVHPSVVYIPGGWAGHEWWMAMSPYPGGNSAFENPSLLASDDGVVWQVPVGITNPIIAVPAEGYNSDPMLVYDGEKLILYNRDENFDIGCITIQSNMAIGELVSTNLNTISPAIIRHSVDDWVAWDGRLKRYISVDGVTWSTGQQISHNVTGMTAWHTGVFWDGTTYHFLVTMYPDALDNGHTSLYYGTIASAEDDLENLVPVMFSGTGWTQSQMYKSCIAKIGPLYRIYVSAKGNSQWHIGYADDWMP